MAIHNYLRKIDHVLERIMQNTYPVENKELIIEYHHVMFAEGKSAGRVWECITILNMIAQALNKPFRDVSKLEMYKFIGDLEKSKKSVYTKHEYKVITKMFYRWLNGGEDPDTTKWIKTTVPKNQSKMPDDLLTEEEVLAMINAASHPRDAALVAVGYDSGARVGELGSLRIKNISFDQYGAFATVSGKTGMRRVRLVMSTPYISTWLSVHPFKDDPDAPLWVNIGKRSRGEPATYDTLLYIFKATAKKAGIQKRVHCHLFRHSRSTDLAQHLTEAQMNEHLGWVQGSSMPRIYVHLSGKQVDEAILKVYGLAKEDETEPLLTPVKCIRCKTINAPASRFCMSCGMAFSTSAASDMDELKRIALDLLLEHPEILEKLKGQK